MNEPVLETQGRKGYCSCIILKGKLLLLGSKCVLVRVRRSLFGRFAAEHQVGTKVVSLVINGEKSATMLLLS